MNYTKHARQQGIYTRRRILEAIKLYIADHGYPPTVREICEMTGISSTSTMHFQMRKMFADGTLETDHPGMPRAIRVPEWKFVREEENEKV